MSIHLKAMVSYFGKALCVMFYIVPVSELTLGDDDAVPKYFLHYGLPMFFAFIFIEYIILRILSASGYPVGGSAGDKPKGGPTAYRLNDFIACTLIGSFQQVCLLLFELVGLNFESTMYTMVYNHCRLATINAKEHPLFVYFALMLGKDLGYYWAHRCMHELHVLWVGHSVHHSGEDYNLATGLRQGVTQPILGWIFYIPLALCGFHPTAFSAHAQLNTLYMFWIHTDLIGRLPFGLEYIFNSPMAHRMHHRPPGNCNYAGMLIIWDRMFGTYIPEITRMDVYGLAQQPNTFDPLKLNMNHVKRLIGSRKAGAADSPSSSKKATPTLFQSLLRKRWHHPLKFDPALLFKPIPDERGDKRAAPKRVKWNGHRALSRLGALFLGAAGLCTIIAGVVLLITKKSMHAMDTAAAIIVWIFAASAVLRFADQYGEGNEDKRGARQTMLLLPVLWAILLARPVQLVMAEEFEK